MEAYRAELDRVLSDLHSLPGRCSETNLKRLGLQNHFEIFEDSIPGGLRLSISGSIVVVDLDLVDNKPASVSISLAEPSAVDNSYAVLHSRNMPNERLLASLKRPRMDIFSICLDYLSRCDRFSTKDINCFSVVDELSAALHMHIKKHATGPQGPSSNDPYGVFQINPERLGVALWYYGPPSSKSTQTRPTHWAYLDVRPGSRPEYSLHSGVKWLDDEANWTSEATHGLANSEDVRTELFLAFVPPVAVPEQLATTWHAILTGKSLKLNRRLNSTTYTVYRHPKFATSECEDEFLVETANLLPYDFVEISHVPLRSPRDIPQILSQLRQFCHAHTLMQSINSGEPVAQSADLDISIADALQLHNQEVVRPEIRVSVTMEVAPADYEVSTKEDSWPILIRVSIPRALAQLTVLLSSPVSTSHNPHISINRAISIPDLHRLVENGNLALVVSYITGSLDVRHSRGSFVARH